MIYFDEKGSFTGKFDGSLGDRTAWRFGGIFLVFDTPDHFTMTYEERDLIEKIGNGMDGLINVVGTRSADE